MSLSTKTADGVQHLSSGATLRLIDAEQGVNYKLVAIDGHDKTKKHLSNLGFIENGNIRVINKAFGNLVLEIKGGRVAIDKGLASRITVTD